nr:hypothetical protein C1892_14790 [Pseudomonas sp. MPBD7-1]
MARELAPAGLRSSPRLASRCVRLIVQAFFGTAAQSSGSELPRHEVTRPLSQPVVTGRKKRCRTAGFR